MGRLVKDPEVKEVGEGKRVMNVRLAVSRSFQNTKGEYDTDFFTIVFWEYLIFPVRKELRDRDAGDETAFVKKLPRLFFGAVL